MIRRSTLLKLLSYDPDLGEFRWNVRMSNRVKEGDLAGCDRIGYVAITIRGRAYLAHRLAWLYVYGRWPKVDLDHKDGVRSHNWISNLREATKSQNTMNSGNYANNKSGYRGVYYVRKSGTWRSHIRYRGSHIGLGTHYTLEDAVAARSQAEQRLFGEFSYRSNRTNG
jgi:hypothetical protein